MTEESAVVNVIPAALRNVGVMAIQVCVEYQVMNRGRVVLVCIVDGTVCMDHGPRNTHGDNRQHQQWCNQPTRPKVKKTIHVPSMPQDASETGAPAERRAYAKPHYVHAREF